MSVQNPYFYREQGITSNLNIVKSYLEGDTDRQGSLSVKVDAFYYFRYLKMSSEMHVPCKYSYINACSLKTYTKTLFMLIRWSESLLDNLVNRS